MLDVNNIEFFEKVETPFWFYDMDLLRTTVEKVVSLSSKYGIDVHYAVKANEERRILEYISSMGLGADCVSGNEIIRYTPIPAVEVSPYSSDNDSTIFSGCIGIPVQFDMRKNQFLIFFPGEIHQTNNQSPESPHVKKVILKVRC